EMKMENFSRIKELDRLQREVSENILWYVVDEMNISANPRKKSRRRLRGGRANSRLGDDRSGAVIGGASSSDIVSARMAAEPGSCGRDRGRLRSSRYLRRNSAGANFCRRARLPDGPVGPGSAVALIATS